MLPFMLSLFSYLSTCYCRVRILYHSALFLCFFVSHRAEDVVVDEEAVGDTDGVGAVDTVRTKKA